MLQRRAARWVKNSYSSYDSVSNMLEDLGWRSFENRRIDSQRVMFYKIIYGYVAKQIPPYFEKLQRYTRHMHPLSFGQTHTSTTNYQQSFYPQQLFFGTGSRQILLFGLILTPSKKESVRSIIGPHKFLTLFLNLLLNFTLH